MISGRSIERRHGNGADACARLLALSRGLPASRRPSAALDSASNRANPEHAPARRKEKQGNVSLFFPVGRGNSISETKP